MLKQDQLLPSFQQKEVEEVICGAGWGENWFQWIEEMSAYNSRMVSKLVLTNKPEFFFKFDVNMHGVRISAYCPCDNDLAPSSTKHDDNWGQRLETVRDWAARLLWYLGHTPATQENLSEGPTIAFVEADKPRTAHLELASFFKELSGDLRICDPYYGCGSLLRLDGLVHCISIRFLTRTGDTSEKSTLPRALTEYTKEHKNVEFRRYNGSDLHDRYVLADKELILLGHGLKDIGNKDSFIVRISRELAPDLIDDLRNAFDTKWGNASPLP